jgi:elongation factor Ts
MAISAKDVQALRQRTGLGMMECKQALSESDGDVEAAIELLRKKLKGKMDERSGRAAAEGVVAAAQGDGDVALVELNSETDFAARNESFTEAADTIARHVLAHGSTGEVEADEAIGKIVDDLRITIKENITYRRGAKRTGEKVGSYVHHNGKVGVILAAEGPIDDQTLTGICQHIAAHVPTPMAVDEAGLPQADRDKAHAEARQEALDSGKPQNIADKIAAGKYSKWVAEHTLLGQQYVKDMQGTTTVAEQLPEGARIVGFVRYAVGA